MPEEVAVDFPLELSDVLKLVPVIFSCQIVQNVLFLARVLGFHIASWKGS